MSSLWRFLSVTDTLWKASHASKSRLSSARLEVALASPPFWDSRAGSGALCAAASAEYYRVNVTRVDKDLYKDHNSGVYIETKFCYEYVIREDAILKYDRYSYDNKLIFDSGTSCGVKALR